MPDLPCRNCRKPTHRPEYATGLDRPGSTPHPHASAIPSRTHRAHAPRESVHEVYAPDHCAQGDPYPYGTGPRRFHGHARVNRCGPRGPERTRKIMALVKAIRRNGEHHVRQLRGELTIGRKVSRLKITDWCKPSHGEQSYDDAGRGRALSKRYNVSAAVGHSEQ